MARHQALAGDWDRKRAAGEKTGRKPVPVEASRRVARQRERLERAEAVAAAQPQQEEESRRTASRAGRKKKKPKPVRNVTDPASALMPVRGGGIKQGYNCQDAAADDRLMLGGFASANAAGTVHAARLEAVAVKGAQVVAAAHADPGHDVAGCHARMCTAEDPGDPGHDAVACHAQMTAAPGRDRVRRRVLLRSQPHRRRRRGPADRHRQPPDHGQGRRGQPRGRAAARRCHRDREDGPPAAHPEGRAAYKRRAPDIEGVHASIEDVIGLRRFSMRGLSLATGEFLLAGLCHNLLLLSRLP